MTADIDWFALPLEIQMQSLSVQMQSLYFDAKTAVSILVSCRHLEEESSSAAQPVALSFGAEAQKRVCVGVCVWVRWLK